MNEQADLLLIEIEERMQKTVDALVREYANVRTGRANPALLDKINIEYYGVHTPLKQISSIAAVEGNQLFIKPFDKSTLKAIEQAIYASDLGLNPQNDGTGIRLILPQLTEERRKSLIKDIDKLAENGKVALRNIRRDGNDSTKKLGLTEDDEKGYLDDIQKLTDEFIKKIDEETKVKASEIIKI